MSARATRAELASILARADGSREDAAAFSAAEVDGWDRELRRALTDARLLRRGHPRKALSCPHCDEDHIVEVAWEGNRALAWCPTAGRMPIDTSLLDSSTLSPRRLAEVLQELLGVGEPLQELVPDRFWRLGAVGSPAPSGTFFLARGLHWDDSARLIEHPAIRRTPEPILLALSDSPAFEGNARLLPLSRVLTVHDGQFAMDMVAARAALAEREAPAPASVFRREGQGWQVIYGSESLAPRDSIGLAYVHCLLRQPFHEFEPVELLSLAAGTSEARQARPDREDELAPSDRRAEPVLDDMSRRALQTEIADLRSQGQSEGADDLEIRLRQATRPGGTAKTFETPEMKAARNVRRSIRRTLDSMQSAAPRLSVHLRGAITLGPGQPLSYHPERPIRWQTD